MARTRPFGRSSRVASPRRPPCRGPGDRGRPTGDVQAGVVVEQAAQQVRRLAGSGLVDLVVTALIVQVVFADHECTDKMGALQEIAESGRVVVAGPAAPVVLRFVDVVSAYRRPDGLRRSAGWWWPSSTT